MNTKLFKLFLLFYLKSTSSTCQILPLDIFYFLLICLFLVYRTAFFLFINDERSKVKQANPEYTVGEVSKELGRRWAAADPSIKGKYEEMADKQKARYERVLF